MSYKVNNKLVWEGKQAMQEFDGEQKKALIQASILVKNAAVKNITSNGNVDTGALRASIVRRTFKTDAVVGTGIEYAPYIEFGTRRSRAFPFLRPAYLLNIEKIKALFSKFYKGVKYVE